MRKIPLVFSHGDPEHGDGVGETAVEWDQLPHASVDRLDRQLVGTYPRVLEEERPTVDVPLSRHHSPSYVDKGLSVDVGISVADPDEPGTNQGRARRQRL